MFEFIPRPSSRVGDDADTQKRLAGATLLVFANKQDLSGSMSLEEIRDVSLKILYHRTTKAC